MEEAKLSANSIALGTLLSHVIFLAQPRPHKHIPSEKEAEMMTEENWTVKEDCGFCFWDVILNNSLCSLHCNAL